MVRMLSEVDKHWPHKSGATIQERFNIAQETKRKSLMEWQAATDAEKRRLQAAAEGQTDMGSTSKATTAGEM